MSEAFAVIQRTLIFVWLVIISMQLENLIQLANQ